MFDDIRIKNTDARSNEVRSYPYKEYVTESKEEVVLSRGKEPSKAGLITGVKS